MREMKKKHLESLLDLSPNTRKTKMLCSEKCKKPREGEAQGDWFEY